MNLFAILKNGELQRLPLSRNIQDELGEFYTIGKNNFINDKDIINFNGEYKAEENEILRVIGFNWVNQIKYLKENNKSTIDIDNPTQSQQLQKNMIENIKILIINLSDHIIFQNVDNRKFIKPKSFLIYSKNTFSFEDRTGIKIDKNIDAVVSKPDELLFSSFHNVSKIFDLSEYYKEATNEEIQSFLQDEIFELDGSFDVINFNQKMRKKIFLINQNQILEKVRDNYNVVKEYANSLGLNDCFNNGKVVIISNDSNSLKRLIDFLNEDLYKSPISGLIYESNSKKKVSG